MRKQKKMRLIIKQVLIYNLFVLSLWLCFYHEAEAQHIAESRLFLSTHEMEPGRIFALKILPTGEIIDLYQQYTTTRWIYDLAITPSKQFMYVAADTTIERFRIKSNGDLISLDTTYFPADPIKIAVTPNNEYVIIEFSDIGCWFFQPTPTGKLIDTYYRETVGMWINPRGNPIIDRCFGYTIWVHHLDYASGTVIRTQIFNNISDNYVKIAYTPDGSIGLMKGFLGNSMDLRVFRIDTTETVTTTQQFNLGNTAKDIAITPDGRYGFLAIDGNIVILSIDTVNGIVTDTGKRFDLNAPISFQVDFIRITDDGKMVVIQYLDDIDERVTTAFIGPDGDLFWTGYIFQFGAAGVIDMELLPIYITDVDSDQWQLYD
jgi:hypothetical protein